MRRALVTGGASSIGRAICLRLARDGLHVIVHAHANLAGAAEVVAVIAAAGGTAEPWRADLRDADATGAALAPVLEGGVPQVVVHNAGTHDDGPMAGMDAARWRDVIDVSLNGFHAVLQPLLLPMIGTRWGRIVAVSSVSAIMGNRGQANYAAAKAGLIGAVKSLAREVGGRGITANAVAPGIIASPATAAIPPEQVAAMVPMKRAGRPEEVAALVGFLASDEAGYVTGQAISVNGGMA